MKKLLLLTAMAVTLLSCSERDRAVTLSNGSVIRAEIVDDVPRNIGTKVCVKRFGTRNWIICANGEMMDTAITSPILIVYSTGYVKSYLD
jgi:hypothetical protein